MHKIVEADSKKAILRGTERAVDIDYEEPLVSAHSLCRTLNEDANKDGR